MDPDSLQQLLDQAAANRRMQEELIRQQQFLPGTTSAAGLYGEDPASLAYLYGAGGHSSALAAAAAAPTTAGSSAAADAAFLASLQQQRQSLLTNSALLPSSLAFHQQQPPQYLSQAAAVHHQPVTALESSFDDARRLEALSAAGGQQYSGMPAGMDGLDEAKQRLAAGLPPSAAAVGLQPQQQSQFNPTTAMAMDGLDARRLAALQQQQQQQQLNPTTAAFENNIEEANKRLSSPADLLATMQQQQRLSSPADLLATMQQQQQLSMDGLQGAKGFAGFDNLAGHGIGVHHGVGGVPPFPGTAATATATAASRLAFQPEPEFDDDDDDDDDDDVQGGGGARLQPVPAAAQPKKAVKRKRKSKEAHPATKSAAAAAKAKSSRASKAPWRTHKTAGGKQHGKWTREERDQFEACYQKYGKDLEKFLPSIPSRNLKQIQSYYSMYKRHKLSNNPQYLQQLQQQRQQQPPQPQPQFGVVPVVKPAVEGETKNRKWNDDEREAFDRAYHKYGKQLEKFQPLIPTRTLKQIKAYYGMYKRYQLTPAEGEGEGAVASGVKIIKKKKKRTNKKQGDKSPTKRAKAAAGKATELGAVATAVAANAPPGNNMEPEGAGLSEEEKVAFELVGFARKNPNQAE